MNGENFRHETQMKETHNALVEACRAAQRYDMAIKGCAFEGRFERLPNGGIATGDDLDALYLDWMTKTYKALALVEMNNP